MFRYFILFSLFFSQGGDTDEPILLKKKAELATLAPVALAHHEVDDSSFEALARRSGSSADKEEDIIIIDNIGKKPVTATAFNFDAAQPMYMHGRHRHLSAAEERQFPFYMTEWNLPKRAFANISLRNF